MTIRIILIAATSLLAVIGIYVVGRVTEGHDDVS